MDKKLQLWGVAWALVAGLTGCDSGPVSVGSDTDDGSSGDETADVGIGSSGVGGSETSGQPTESGEPSGGETGEGWGACGDGVVDPGEQCDGLDVDGASCTSMGAYGGRLWCRDDCTLELCECEWASGDEPAGCEPAVCGDGVAEGSESCDGSDIPTWDEADSACEAVLGFPYHGSVSCTDDCRLDTDSCTSCGDGILQGSYEECDGTPLDVDGEPLECSSELGDEWSGTPGCAECEIDYSTCYQTCGDGVVDEGEQCDGEALGDDTCESLGFMEGTLSCDSNCQFQTSSCVSFCGNGELDESEECDGQALGAQTCESLGFVGGQLQCSNACEYALGDCHLCGNGVVDPGETCDETDFGGVTCGDFVVGGVGELGCSATCEIESVECSAGGGTAIISEIMPIALLEPLHNSGEWLELHNSGNVDFSLSGCSLRGLLALETFYFEDEAVVPAGGYLTLGKGTLEELGFEPDFELAAQTTFFNTGDIIRIECAGLLLDEVEYDDVAPWPTLEPGMSISTRAGVADPLDNDAAASWCASGTEYATGFRGSPGAANVCAL